MDTAQILLVVVVSVLTVILSLVGFEVFLILKEFKKTVSKTNKILDDTGLISESVAKPIAGLSGFLTGLKDSANLVKLLADRFGDDEEEPENKKGTKHAK
jgi:hypothetical protein